MKPQSFLFYLDNINNQQHKAEQSHPKGTHPHFAEDFNYPIALAWSVYSLCICLAFVIRLPEVEGLTSTLLSKLGLDLWFNCPAGTA